MKTCRKCGSVEFSQRGDCKECARIRSRAYNSANREKVREKHAIYYKNNIEKRKKYIQENREKILEQLKEYYKSHKDSKIEYTKRHKEENRIKYRLYENTRRSRKANSDGSLSQNIAAKLMLLQQNKCAICKKQLGNDYHIDHIMPLSLGGANTDDNVQLLHSSCNLKKHKKHPIDYMQSIGFLL